MQVQRPDPAPESRRTKLVEGRCAAQSLIGTSHQIPFAVPTGKQACPDPDTHASASAISPVLATYVGESVFRSPLERDLSSSARRKSRRRSCWRPCPRTNLPVTDCPHLGGARCTGLRAMAAWSRPVAWHGYAQRATRDRDVGSSGVETVLVAGNGAAAEQGVDELSCWSRSSRVGSARLAVTLHEHSSRGPDQPPAQRPATEQIGRVPS